mgnify:CR=1 FL=1
MDVWNHFLNVKIKYVAEYVKNACVENYFEECGHNDYFNKKKVYLSVHL